MVASRLVIRPRYQKEDLPELDYEERYWLWGVRLRGIIWKTTSTLHKQEMDEVKTRAVWKDEFVE